MSSTNLNNMMDTTMENIRQMVDVNTIIGEPVICPDGTVIVPVSKVSYGFASGGSDLPPKTNTQKEFFAGGSGAGVSIQPVAFLVISNGQVKMLNMEFDGAVDRIVSMVPDVADKIGELIKKLSQKKNKDVDFVKDSDPPVTVEEPVIKSEPKTKAKNPDNAVYEDFAASFDEAADVD